MRLMPLPFALYAALCSIAYAQAKESPVNSLMPLADGPTLAQFGPVELPHTLLVLADDGETLHGVDLSERWQRFHPNPFDVIADVDLQQFDELLPTLGPAIEVSCEDLLPLGRWSDANVAAGANYKAHAEESDVQGGSFLFPKLSAATPPNASLGVLPTDMLDYEVELAVTLDRDLRNVSELDTARMGFFVCIDFSERAILSRLADRNDVQSGKGFPEGKGFKGSFQTGPFMAVPVDPWGFMERAEISLTVNDEPRQQASVTMMETPMHELLAQALAYGDTPRWTYHDKPVAMLPTGIFSKGTTLLTGTPEGVAFAPPSGAYIAKNALIGIVTFGFLGQGLQRYVVERFITDSIASGRFLKPGDVVVARGSQLGAITSRVVAATTR